MHTQVECAFIDKVTPSFTNLREITPPMSVIPTVFLIQSVAVEYAEEYIVFEPMDSRVRHIESSSALGSWWWQS